MTTTENRTPIKNLLLSLLHWFMVTVLSIVSFILQYSFLTNTGEKYTDILFSGSFYQINYVTFSLGVLLFMTGFYFIWRKFLSVDWMYFKKRVCFFKILYIVMALITTFSIFWSSVLIQFFNLGLAGEIVPEWTTFSYIAFPIYMIIVIIIDSCIRMRNTQN